MPDKTPPRITKDPETGRLMLDGQLLERNDPRLWGTAGNIAAFGTPSQRISVDDAQSMARFVDNPYYDRGPDEVDSEGGGTYATFTIKPEVAERLAGRVQLGQSGVGGYDELESDVDLDSLEYDPEFGILVNPDQIGAGDRGRGRQLRNIALAGIAAMGGLAAVEAMAAGGTAGAVDAGAMAMPELTAAANPAIAAAPEIGAGAAGASTATTAAPGIVSSVAVPADLTAGTVAAASPTLSAAPAIPNPSWWSTLTPNSQSLIARAGLQAAGTGASAVMQGIGQRNAQEFAAEQADTARQDRLDREARERAERDSLRTVAPRNIRITPRAGIIASNMRGG